MVQPAEEPQTSTRMRSPQLQRHLPTPMRMADHDAKTIKWVDKEQLGVDTPTRDTKPGFPLWDPQPKRTTPTRLDWDVVNHDPLCLESDPVQVDESLRQKKVKRVDYSSSNGPSYLDIDDAKLDANVRAAHRRNTERIRLANLADEAIIGKYLPSSATAFFPCRWVGPEDNIESDDEWLASVLQVAQSESPLPTKPDLEFSTAQAINNNAEMLANFDFELSRVLESQKGTTAGHGSEFRPVSQLERFLKHHPSFDYLCNIFSNGMGYAFEREISEDERVEELQAQIDRGNHKSALEELDRIQELLEKDVKHGFCLPLPANIVSKIKGAMVQPCGIVSQFTLTKDGDRVKKKRLTHDLSFSITGDGRSVNERVDMSQYPDMVYGWCLLWIIHYIVALRAAHPEQKIFI